MIVFVAIFCALTALTHRYIYVRLFRDPRWSSRRRRLGKWGVVTLGVFMIGVLLPQRWMPRELAVALANPAFVWMGAVALLVPLLLLVDLLRWPIPMNPERRTAISRLGAGLATLSTVGLGAAGVRNAMSAPEVERVRVPLTGLPQGLRGLRIVHLSDLHLGPSLGRDFMIEIVRRVNELEPELVAITGDLVDGSVERLRDVVLPLVDLKSRFGTFFCTGNHEYYSGCKPWVSALREMGVLVLCNERVSVVRGGATLDLIGVDDLQGRDWPGEIGCDLDEACRGRDTSRTSILLAHQPKVIHDVALHGIDLQLSGHTHGGQIWPIGYITTMIQTYLVGLHQHSERTFIYVHPGTGFWGPPLRLGTRSVITVLELG